MLNPPAVNHLFSQVFGQIGTSTLSLFPERGLRRNGPPCLCAPTVDPYCFQLVISVHFQLCGLFAISAMCGCRGVTRHSHPAALVFLKSQVLRQCLQSVKRLLWAPDHRYGMHPNWWPGLLASSYVQRLSAALGSHRWNNFICSAHSEPRTFIFTVGRLGANTFSLL